MYVRLIGKFGLSLRTFSIQVRKCTLVVISEFDMAGPSPDTNLQHHPFPY